MTVDYDFGDSTLPEYIVRAARSAGPGWRMPFLGCATYRFRCSKACADSVYLNPGGVPVSWARRDRMPAAGTIVVQHGENREHRLVINHSWLDERENQTIREWLGRVHVDDERRLAPS